MYKKMLLMALFNLALTATYLETEGGIQFRINLPNFVAPAKPAFVAPALAPVTPASVYAPGPIHVQPAPAPGTVQPPPAPVYGQPTPIPIQRWTDRVIG